jgi:hypothetical protein
MAISAAAVPAVFTERTRLTLAPDPAGPQLIAPSIRALGYEAAVRSLAALQRALQQSG